MKYLIPVILFSVSVFINAAEAQDLLNTDPARVKSNFLDVDYFNNIWLKSADINKDDVVGFAKRASDKIEKGYYEEAYNDISAAISLKPDYGYPHLLKGIYFLHRNMLDSAEVSLLRSLRIDTLDIRTMFYLGLTRMYSNDYKGSEAYFRNIIKNNDKESRGYYGLATLELARGNYFSGRALMKKTVRIDPGFVQAIFSLGMMDLLEKNLSSAKDYMDQAISVSPGFGPAWFLKGMIEMDNPKTLRSGFSNLNKAIKLEPDNVGYLSGRAIAYQKLEMMDSAINDISRSLNILCKEKKLLNQERFNEEHNALLDSYFVLDIYQKHNNELKPENRKQLQMSVFNFFFGQYCNANNILTQIKTSDNNAFLNLLAGIDLEYCGIRERALEEYKMAETKAPDIYYSSFRSGMLNYRREKYEAAIFDLNRSLRLNDSVYQAYGWRGMANFKLKRYPEASRDFTLYLNKDSSSVEILFNRAVIFIDYGHYDKALKDLDKVLFYSEKYPNALDLRTECLFHLEDFPGVLEMLGRKPTGELTIDDHRMMGFSFMRTGKYSNAIEHLEKYLEVNGEDIQANIWRGTCYYSISDYNNAIKDFSKCIGLNSKEGVIYYLRGMCYLKLKDLNSACKDFENAETNGYKVPFSFRDTCPH